MGRNLRWGDVRWYRFASPDKRRPVVLLTRQSALDVLEEITVAPVTTRVRDIPTEVVLTKDDGLPRRCAVNLDHLRTVPRSKLGGVVATLTHERMCEVRVGLLFALGFDAT